MKFFKKKRKLNLKWGKHWRGCKIHMEWHAPCGCAYHPEPEPHVHKCIRHSTLAELEVWVPEYEEFSRG